MQNIVTVSVVLWYIWKERNAWIFQGKDRKDVLDLSILHAYTTLQP